MSANVVTLGGRNFKRLEESTVEHDFWMMGHLREAKLDRIEIAEGEAPETAIEALLTAAIVSGKALVLLAGLLIPEGMESVDWTPAVGDATLAHLKRLTALQDKEQIRPLTASMLVGFFASGLVSLRTSPRSSEKTAGEAVPAHSGTEEA